jgi:hypothetical protein
MDNDKGKKNNQDTRAVQFNFCLGMSKWWDNWSMQSWKHCRTNMDSHGYEAMSMSYHKFFNLREIFQGDLNQKVMDGIISRDFMDWPCNCKRASKIDRKCVHNKECRKMCVVYKATCKICDKFYIGQTQQKLKDQIGQHLNDIKNLGALDVCMLILIICVWW